MTDHYRDWLDASMPWLYLEYIEKHKEFEDMQAEILYINYKHFRKFCMDCYMEDDSDDIDLDLFT